jgi:hypothetical protein
MFALGHAGTVSGFWKSREQRSFLLVDRRERDPPDGFSIIMWTAKHVKSILMDG